MAAAAAAAEATPGASAASVGGDNSGDGDNSDDSLEAEMAATSTLVEVNLLPVVSHCRRVVVSSQQSIKKLLRPS